MPPRGDKGRDAADQQAKQLGRIRDEADRLPQADAEPPLDPSLPPDRTRRFTHVNLSRLRVEWKPDDSIIIQEIMRRADAVMVGCFPDAYWFLENVYRKVRTPLTDDDGVKLKDHLGLARWKRDEHGVFVEDWSKLTDRDRETLLYQLTTHMIEWRQQAATMWGSAMLAKGKWEGEFALGYTTPNGRLTIDDRTQMGHLAAIEERYFAIYESLLSRRADAFVRSLERLEAVLMKNSI
jgi:hypothetical protein